uniref:Uncharacterized protein n=1 Tax=Magallana gigas TaxID=29159 RepID=K1P4Z3_MAGGI
MDFCIAYYTITSTPCAYLYDVVILNRSVKGSGTNRVIHYYECGIVKFHRGDKIHGLGRGFAKS